MSNKLSDGRWKIGDPGNPSEEDHCFHDEQKAVEAARHMSRDDYQRAVAVWDMEECVIVHLFVCGQQFRSV